MKKADEIKKGKNIFQILVGATVKDFEKGCSQLIEDMFNIGYKKGKQEIAKEIFDEIILNSVNDDLDSQIVLSRDMYNELKAKHCGGGE